MSFLSRLELKQVAIRLERVCSEPKSGNTTILGIEEDLGEFKNMTKEKQKDVLEGGRYVFVLI